MSEMGRREQLPSPQELAAIINKTQSGALAALKTLARDVARLTTIEQGVPQAQNPTIPLPDPDVKARGVADVLMGCKVDAFSRRPYVVVMASHPVKGTVLGVAKVSHGDRWDPEHGLDIALRRAAREMGKRR